MRFNGSLSRRAILRPRATFWSHSRTKAAGRTISRSSSRVLPSSLRRGSEMFDHGKGRGFVSPVRGQWADRKSTRLNSSHSQISYAVFCLKIITHAQTAGHYFTNDQINSLPRTATTEVDLVHQQTQTPRYGSSHISATADDISTVVTYTAS